MEPFYVGNAPDEEVKGFLKGPKKEATGFCNIEKGEWAAIVDRIAKNSYGKLAGGGRAVIYEPQLVEPNLQRVHMHKREISVLNMVYMRNEEGLKHYPTIRYYERSSVKDDDLVWKILYQINETVLHEVALHQVGGLIHEIDRIDFGEGVHISELEKIENDYKELKIGAMAIGNVLQYVSFIYPSRGTARHEKYKQMVRKLSGELASRFEANDKQNSFDYPISFEMEDITIKPKQRRMFGTTKALQ